MPLSPLDIVGCSPPHAGEALVPDTSWLDLRAIAAPLPACASSVGYECRLIGEQTADLGLSVSLAGSGASVLAGLVGDGEPGARVAAIPQWQRLRRFALRWTAAASPLATRVPFIFLELDTGGPPTDAPVPSVFLGLDWLLSELELPRSAQAPLLVEVLEAASSLRGAPLDPAATEAAHHCFAALPVGGVLLHAGIMLSRPGEYLRLSAAVPRAQLTRYLAAIGRHDGIDAIAEAVERFATWGGFEHPASLVQLDFDPASADTRVGLTLRPSDYRTWPQLLHRLVAEGLCEPDRAAALLRWSGISSKEADLGQPPIRLARTIEHVKLVCQVDRLVGAKAYFGATER